MHAKRRPNNGMGGGNNRHHNNRPRRFGNSGGRPGGDDNANAARTRRHAQQQREKYQNMARDALSMGDRVLAENYLQHADHFHRVILSLPPEEPRHQHQPRHHQDGMPAGQEAQQMDAGDSVSDMPEQPMPSAAALPSFITQQPVMNHPPQNFEE